MELSGGNYGGYEFIDDSIKLDDKIIIVNFITDSEFYIIDNIGNKWSYNIGAEGINFSGIN